MKTRNRVPWFVLVLAGCASDPGTGPSPREDAGTPNDVAVVDNDRPAPPPDAVRKDDAGTPTPDAPDAGVPQDVQQPEDHGPPPPDATMGFDPAICTLFRSRRWRFQGEPGRGDTIGCDMHGAEATLTLPDNLAARMGETTGRCSGTMCRVPGSESPAGCTWTGLSSTMSFFQCSCAGGGSMTVESAP